MNKLAKGNFVDEYLLLLFNAFINHLYMFHEASSRECTTYNSTIFCSESYASTKPKMVEPIENSRSNIDYFVPHSIKFQTT